MFQWLKGYFYCFVSFLYGYTFSLRFLCYGTKYLKKITCFDEQNKEEKNNVCVGF